MFFRINFSKVNFTFIEVFIGDRSHIFKKKEKMQSINKHASFYYVSTTLVAMFIFELPAQLYRHSFSTNEGNIDEQTSSRIEAIIHCSSKCRENIASWIFLSISTSKNRQKQSSLFRLRYQIVPLTVEFIAHDQSNLVQ